jgi:hypothetical protein
VINSPEPVSPSQPSASSAIPLSRSLDGIYAPSPKQALPNAAAQIVSVIEPVECTDPLKLALKKIADLEHRIEQAERR